MVNVAAPISSGIPAASVVAAPAVPTSRRHTACLFTAAGAVFCLTPAANSGIALALGMGIALVWGNPSPALVTRATRPLLQGSVVLLGFGMNLLAVLAAAREGFFLALATIVLTFGLGAVLGRALGLKNALATLLSAGTAICGGSAIAATALAIGAAAAEISVALATVFLLNAVGLYLFPIVGHALDLSQDQFGMWTGVAIHDVSSVVGAAAGYGPAALETATAVKLSRTLWILPAAIVAGALARRHVPVGSRATPLPMPWFIGFFLLALLAGTFVPAVASLAPALLHIARAGMTLTLFFIGLGLSREALRSVGVRPLVHGLVLWATLSAASLAAACWLAP